MGRKDAGGSKGTSGVQSTPVETYRKQIGKHDYNKSKKKLKSAKAHSELQKSATPIKDTLLILVTGLLLVVGLYFILYWYLKKEPS